MVSLKLLSGRQAGTTVPLGQLPFAIGRSPGSSLVLDDPGVWDRHLELTLDTQEGFFVRLEPNAAGTLNGQPFQHARLRNGDLIEAASTKLQFLVSPPVQRGFRAREILTWVGFGLLTALQLYLIYWLVQ